MTRPNSALIVIHALLLLVSLLAAYLVYHSWTFRNRCEHYPGVVVDDFIEAPNTHFPTVAFVYRGDTIQVRSTTGTDPAEYAIGESVDMLVPPDNARDARINSFNELWLVPTVVGGFAVVLLVISLLVRHMAARNAESMAGIRAQLENRLHATSDAQHSHTTRELSPSEIAQQQREFRERFAEAERSNSRVMEKVAMVFMVIGLIMLGAAAWLGDKEYQFTKTNPQYSARIVDYGQQGQYNYALYECINEHGDTLRAYSRSGSTRMDAAIGTPVQIYIDPSDNTASEAGLWNQYIGALLCGIFGLVFLGFGLLFRFLMARDLRAAESQQF